MNWIPLESINQVQSIRDRSFEIPCLIFKHSTRCNVSAIALYRLESDWDFSMDEMEVYFLDLIKHREVSNYISEFFDVFHESPQALIIQNGACVYDASHMDISVADLKEGIDVNG